MKANSLMNENDIIDENEQLTADLEKANARVSELEGQLASAKAQLERAKAAPAKPQPEPAKERESEITLTEKCREVRKAIARPIPKSENLTATCRATVQENRRQLEAVRTLSSSN